MASRESLVALEAPPEDADAPEAIEALFDVEAPPEDSEAAPFALPVTGPAGEAEGIKDPIVPPRPPLAITGSVGRGARNMPADVRAVQDRLVELRALDRSYVAGEQPAGTAALADTSLPRTITAIESFQRHSGIAVDGKVDLKSPTRTDLDRAIPLPSATAFTAAAAERNAIAQTVSRGLTLKGPVGATATGNAPDDVREVQRRLVELGKLSAAHHETPAAGSTGIVPQSSLRATIAALRTFQQDVKFWSERRRVAGTITPGVVAPGDATAALLDRVSVYTMGTPTSGITFRDHVVSGVTESADGVMFVGTAPPSAIAIGEYEALGLSKGQAAALKFVSAHEGNFDAINTYDRALVSVGFIQFAGSRGLPPYLALLKARQPASFRDELQKYGIDVEFTVAGGAINAARVVVLDSARSRLLRAAAAERAVRDDKRLTAALILSGRQRRVQLAQIEAAIRDYVLPSLAAIVSWGPGGARAPLGDLLRSQKGMAALFDRAIQEGLAAARRRFERLIQRIARGTEATPPPPPAVAELQRREGDVLAELERDLQAAADVATRIARARTALRTLHGAASAAGATVPGVMARPELAAARQAVRDARAGLSSVINVSTPRGASVDATLASIDTTLTAEESRLSLTPPPASVAALASSFSASTQTLGTAAGPLSTSHVFLARIQRIRRSTLDASLAEADEDAS